MSDLDKQEKALMEQMPGCLGFMIGASFAIFGLVFILFVDELIGLFFAIIGVIILVVVFSKNSKKMKQTKEQTKEDEKGVDDTLDKF